MLTINQAFIFLFLILILSVPFYWLGKFSPIKGLSFDLPLSFLMILVPFSLALFITYYMSGWFGMIPIIARIFDWYRTSSEVFALTVLLTVGLGSLTYLVQALHSGKVPIVLNPSLVIPMFVSFFFGALLEEFGWTLMVTEPLALQFGPTAAGFIIGIVWAAWHVTPWSWSNSWKWVGGMSLATILMRIIIVYLYQFGGQSLFAAIIYHMLMNVTFAVYPELNPWLLSLVLFAAILLLIFFWL